MSTTFAIRTNNGELRDIARRVGGPNGASMFWLDAMAELLPVSTQVEAIDNTPQGVFTIGDIKYHMDHQNKVTEEAEEDLEDPTWIDDPSKIEYYQRKSVFAPMTDGWHKDHDFIEVTEWKNGEGWDIEIAASPNSKHVSLHFTEFAVIKELIALLEKN